MYYSVIENVVNQNSLDQLPTERDKLKMSKEVINQTKFVTDRTDCEEEIVFGSDMV